MRQAPAYCVHKSRNLAFVRLSGRMIYLGRAHSQESRERYHAVLADHYAGKQPEPAPRPRRQASAFTVAELAERWCQAEAARRGPRHQAAYEAAYAAKELARQHATAWSVTTGCISNNWNGLGLARLQRNPTSRLPIPH